MEKKQPYHPDHEALARYFSEEISAEERRTIEEWRDSSPEHLDSFVTYQTIWADLGTLSGARDLTIDTSMAWQKVKAKKGEHDSHNNAPIQWWWKVAAALVLISGMAFLYQSLFSQTEEITYSAKQIETLRLPDGSDITLNANATLTYPEYMDKSRVLTLEGEAYFEVTHNPNNPFVISTGGATITVLGTSFNVKSMSDRVEVQVETGRVSLASPGQEALLTAGMKGVYLTNNQQISSDTSDPTGQGLFWKTRKLTFEGEALESVIQTLKTAYGITITLENDRLSTCRLSAVFEEEDLQTVLQVISLSLNLEVTQTEDGYLIKGAGCDM
jgi:ferric-dicitrate binding protein FerR (iron transport regulator)